MLEVELNKLDKFLMKINWYSFCRFIDNWVYPGHYLKNLLFHRHDRIKVPQIKPWEYCDITEIMLYANMELIIKFVEKEEPEKHILWYYDEEGNVAGHIYGEGEKHGYSIIYPEYKGEFVMDIIKEIYNWWKDIYPREQKDYNYLLNFWANNLYGKIHSEQIPGTDFGEMESDKSDTIKTLEDLYELKPDWNILDYYFDSRADILDEEKFKGVLGDLEKKMYNDCQKYLHLCIEVRPFLWT